MSLDNFRNRTIIWDTVNKDFPQPIQIMQGDVNARTLLIKIVDNGVEIDLTGHSLKLTYQYTNNGNSGFVIIPPKDLVKGEFILVIPTEMTTAGVIEANLILLNESLEQVIVSKSLTFISDNSTVTDLAQEVNNKIDDFTKLLLENIPQVMRSELNDLHAQAESNKSNISLMSNGDYSPKANQTDLDNLKTDVTSQGAEIKTARGTAPTLNVRLNKMDNKDAEITAQLAQTELKLKQKPNKDETGWATLNTFDESTRAVIQGIKPGEINAVLGEGNVTPFNTNFFKNGTNLYNPATTKSDVYYKYDSGNEYPAAGYFGSGLIPVEPNKKYFIRTARHIVFTNQDGSYVSGVKDTSSKSDYVVTIPENARRMRISWNGNDNRLPQQVNKGDKELPYEPYREYIPKELTEAHDINPEKIHDVTIDKLSFSKMKSNLFDKSKAQLNKTINNLNGKALTATGFAAYENMPVKPGGVYTIKRVRSYAWKDPKGVFISGSPDASSKQNATITAPSNAALLSFSWYPSSDLVTVEQQQVNEGTELLPYEEYGYYIPSEFIENETGSGQSGVSLKLNLPPEIYAVTGKEVNIYFENIANLPLSDYQVDVTCSLGKQMSDRWTANPTNSGDHPITIAVYKDFEMVAQVNSTVKVKTSAVGSGIEKDAIIVGDSTIAQDFLINHLEDTFGTDPLTINFKGTRGTYGELHNEGYAGWTVHDLRTNKTYNDVVHPFYNPIKADFDFAYYMTNQGYTGLDYVVLCFGINDTFSFTNDSTLLNKIPNILTDFNYIINNIRAYDSNIKIGVCVTIPPNANQDAFGNAYYTGQTQWRYKRNNALWIEQLINAFKGKTPQNIYLIPDNSGIDTTIGFRDAVHPNKDVGDKQRADTFYSWFKSFEV